MDGKGNHLTMILEQSFQRMTYLRQLLVLRRYFRQEPVILQLFEA